MSSEPLLPNPDCSTCAALTAALKEAMSLLSAVDSDANNVQLDIARMRRRHHAADALARAFDD